MIRRFLGNVLATFIGISLFTGLVIFFIFTLVSSSSTVTVDQKSVLLLKLNSNITELDINNPVPNLNNPLNPVVDGTGLMGILHNIEKAKNDPNIAGIVLHLQSIGAGFASLKELREALNDFRQSKKFVWAYGEYLSEGAYYLASVASKIYLNPTGSLEFNGLSAQRTFYKGAFDKLDIKPEIFRVGTYKSAVEPYMTDKMSEASRRQTQSYLNSIYDLYLKDIAASRKVSLAQLTQASDSGLVQSPADALKYQLITKIGYYDELEAEIKKRLDLKENQKIKWVRLGKYREVETEWEKQQKKSNHRIAVIVADGEIRSGNGGDGVVGATKIVKALRRARKSKSVKAIVLRVNSPGGSALASDIMWREIHLTRKVKPVIASMSDVAASGGYYIAMACDTIVAQPNTITGSIGIFSIYFNLAAFQKNKLGITNDYVNTGKFSALGDPSYPFTEADRQILQRSVERGYESFTSKAAKDRGMSLAELKSVASGRVWAGNEAKQNGLVDVLGSFNDALAIAAKKAKLNRKDYRLWFLPVEKPLIDKIKDNLGVSVKARQRMLKQELGELYPYLEILKKIKETPQVQARLPYDIVIK
ncbi:signal peptide peptidase SppA [uncultured Microscilla sp.]|uniref:signal peptide peptidase SppA n=1 Tax=uncultured Microscilla sp. TaxID=432653 RepID=UPI0026382191|nr:signal peptide peptidase SppA [uncultured Microscilla sp.]